MAKAPPARCWKAFIARPGLRVGLFTSPHLVSFRERIQVNRQLISEDDVVRLVAEIQPLLQQFPADAHPTMFEFVTVMALKYFAEQKCDLVIWETGLGGRLDATNIVTPLASVITNIAFDHQQWLGDTLEKIAAEKAGIIKPGVPVVTATDAPEALAVIEEIAREKNAPLTKVAQASQPARRSRNGGAAFARRTSKTQCRAGAGDGGSFAKTNSRLRRKHPRRPGQCELAGTVAIDPDDPTDGKFCSMARTMSPGAEALRAALEKEFRRNASAAHFWRAGGQKLAGHLPGAGAAGGKNFHRAGRQRAHGGRGRTGKNFSRGQSRRRPLRRLKIWRPR